jgi:hypothetical protein
MRTFLVPLMVSAAVCSAATAPPSSNDERVPIGTVLARASEYAARFESAFALVICDEAYEQDIQTGQGPLPAPSVSRRMQSEMLFMWLADDRHWLSVRNVLVVNGKRVADGRAGLEQVLQQPLPERESRLHRLAEHSARFNIGSIYRNFNNPTLALQFVDATYRSRFMFTFDAADRDEVINGTSSRKVNFIEVQRPTLIDEHSQDRPATGALWIHVADGTVVRTNLRLPGRATVPEVSITVDYQLDPKLEMRVPSRMEELYRTIVMGENSGSTMRSVTRFNSIRAVATYSNFRRFETSGRLLTPK